MRSRRRRASTRRPPRARATPRTPCPARRRTSSSTWPPRSRTRSMSSAPRCRRCWRGAPWWTCAAGRGATRTWRPSSLGSAGKVVGVEPNAERLAIAQKYLDKEMKQFGYGQPNVELVRGVPEDLSFLADWHGRRGHLQLHVQPLARQGRLRRRGQARAEAAGGVVLHRRVHRPPHSAGDFGQDRERRPAPGRRPVRGGFPPHRPGPGLPRPALRGDAQDAVDRRRGVPLPRHRVRHRHLPPSELRAHVGPLRGLRRGGRLRRDASQRATPTSSCSTRTSSSRPASRATCATTCRCWALGAAATRRSSP